MKEEKPDLKITDAMRMEFLMHLIVTDEKFVKVFAKVKPRIFLSTEPRQSDLVNEIVGWYTTTGKLPTEQILRSRLEAANKVKGDIEGIISEYRKYISSEDASTISNEDLRTHSIEFIRSRATKKALIEGHAKIDKDGTTQTVDSVLKGIEELVNAFAGEDSVGESFGSQTCPQSIDEYIKWLDRDDSRIMTMIPNLDEKIGGGIIRNGKGMYIFVAQTGLGKSNMIANIAVNMMKQNLSPLIVSFEMDWNAYFRRIASIMTNTNIDEHRTIEDELRDKLNEFVESHKNGLLRFKEFPTSSASSKDIEDFVTNTMTDRKPDVILVDYLGIVAPNRARKNGNMYEDRKMVAEELRALSQKLGIPVITATQCNTEGMDSEDVGLKNTSESRGIAHTADFICVLYKSDEDRKNEKENGKGLYSRIYAKIVKSRYGESDQTFPIAINNKTLRILPYEDVEGMMGTIKQDVCEANICEADNNDKQLTNIGELTDPQLAELFKLGDE